MLEVTSGILGTDRRKRFAQYVYQSVLRTGCCLPQHTLDLAESFFYRVEVRRVGGQIDQLAAPTFDQLPYPGRFVGFKRLSRITTCPAFSVGARARSR
jgi:hypothetical protein